MLSTWQNNAAQRRKLRTRAVNGRDRSHTVIIHQRITGKPAQLDLQTHPRTQKTSAVSRADLYTLPDRPRNVTARMCGARWRRGAWPGTWHRGTRPSRDPGRMGTAHVQGDLGTGVAQPDDKHGALLKLCGITVGAGVQLNHGWREAVSEPRHSGRLTATWFVFILLMPFRRRVMG